MANAVVIYDKYFDIPLRGLLQMDSSIFAFDARVLDDEPVAIAERRGIYSRIRAFECDDELRLLLEEKDGIFRKVEGSVRQRGRG